MKSDRLVDLLKKASKAFEDGQDPFHSEWLAENHVTLDECMDLSLAISSAIDLFIIPLRRATLSAELKKAVRGFTNEKR